MCMLLCMRVLCKVERVREVQGERRKDERVLLWVLSIATQLYMCKLTPVGEVSCFRHNSTLPV